MKRLNRRIRTAMDDLRTADPMVESFGQTVTTAMDGFVFCNTFALLAADLAIRWQASNLDGASLASIVTEFPTRCLATAALVAFAMYVQARGFHGCIGRGGWRYRMYF